MSGVVENIRAKIKRRFSHKEQNRKSEFTPHTRVSCTPPSTTVEAVYHSSRTVLLLHNSLSLCSIPARRRRSCLGAEAKPPPANFDEHDEADEETTVHLNKEVDDAEKNDEEPYGKPGSLLNRMIMHGNKKTEDQIASENAASGGGAQRTGP
jgi:hypothetical protein